MKNFETLRSTYGRMNSSDVDIYKDKDSVNILTNACPAQEISIFPLRAKNINNEWKVIVNVGNVFMQKVGLTKCRLTYFSSLLQF